MQHVAFSGNTAFIFQKKSECKSFAQKFTNLAVLTKIEGYWEVCFPCGRLEIFLVFQKLSVVEILVALLWTRVTVKVGSSYFLEKTEIIPP